MVKNPQKRQQQKATAPLNETNICKEDGVEGTGKKTRKVVIDSDEDDEEEMEEEAKKNKSDEDDDEVISEVDVFLLPVAPHPDCTPSASQVSISLNRLQFAQQRPHMLRQRFNNKMKDGGDEEEEQKGRTKCCAAHYKAQVKHLRLEFGLGDGDAATSSTTTTTSSSSGAFGGGGLAELLTKSNTTTGPSTVFPAPLIGQQQPQQLAGSPSASASSSQSSIKSSSSAINDLFTGEGFSQHDVLSNAIGRLFLLPVDKTYEMRKPLTGTIEREAVRVAQKASSSSSCSLSGSLLKTSSNSAATAMSSSSAAVAPLRIRFARPENDLQRRRREQSSFYKQKLVEQDQWVQLSVEQKSVADLYHRQIDEALSSASSSSMMTLPSPTAFATAELDPAIYKTS